jgi:hypothetical protein
MPVLVAIDNAFEAIEAAVADLPRVSAAKIGLDPRAGYVYVDLEDEAIVAESHNIRSLDYYGGFEYVDEDAVSTIGNYKIYSADSERVAGALEYFEEHNED